MAEPAVLQNGRDPALHRASQCRPSDSCSFRGDRAQTARAFPLLRDERLIVGAFCAMSTECYGLFFDDDSAMVMRFEQVPADIVTASLDSYLFPVAHAHGRTLAVVQFQSAHPQIRDAAALVAHDQQTNSWSVWRRAERAVCSETDGVVAWLGPAGIELFSPETAAPRATVPLPRGDRVDRISCDRTGRRAAYASGSRVTILDSSGEIGREWARSSPRAATRRRSPRRWARRPELRSRASKSASATSSGAAGS